MDPDRQVTEIRETRTIEPAEPTTQRTDRSVPGSVLAARIVYYIGGAILLLLLLRFILALLGANRANPFADFIFTVSYPFAAPFFGLFSYDPTYGSSQVEFSTFVAMAVVAILTVGIAKLITIGRREGDATV